MNSYYIKMKSLLFHYLFICIILLQIDGSPIDTNPVIINTEFIQSVMCSKEHRSHASFSYRRDSVDGPQCWPRIDIQCAGKYQSPINIDTDTAKLIYTKSQVTCTKWADKPNMISIENTGYYIRFDFTYSDGKPPTLFATPMTDIQYKLAQAHVHFIGSEHTFNTISKFSMEGHIVFYNWHYNSLDEAAGYKDGILVVTKFFKLSEKAYFEFPYLDQVKYPNNVYKVMKGEAFSLKDMFGEINFNFYTYSGSLTTPGCNEAVRFMLDDKPLTISPRILSDLASIQGSEGNMSPNIRPLQPLNKRKIMYYNPKK